jgi:hypothetical protein
MVQVVVPEEVVTPEVRGVEEVVHIVHAPVE